LKRIFCCAVQRVELVLQGMIVTGVEVIHSRAFQEDNKSIESSE